jgi:virulence-associated protein VapD
VTEVVLVVSLLVAYLLISKKWTYFRYLTVTLLILCFSQFSVLSDQVFALSSSGASVQITAIVEPACHVIINQNGQIIEIVTNTKNQITPIVTLNSISGNQISMTPKIYNDYQNILNKYRLQGTYGVIYRINDRHIKTASYANNSIFSLSRIISIEKINIF